MISGGTLYTFVCYEIFKRKYLDAQQKLNAIIEEKENLFSRTQPKSPNWDKMPSSESENAFDSYLIAKEKTKIDQRIKEMQKIVDERRSLMRQKEQELYESKDLCDKIYRMKYLESKTVPDLMRKLHFGRTQIYKFISIVQSEIACLKYVKEFLQF